VLSVRRLTAASLRWIAGAVLGAGMVLGATIASTPTARAPAVSLRTPTDLGCEPVRLFRRNVSAVTVLSLGIVTAGTMTIIALVTIGVVVSAAILRFWSMGVPAIALIAGTLPHGIFEIPGFIWAGGAGLSGARLAVAMLSADSSTAVDMRQELMRAGRAYVIAVVCVAIGAVVECYVTPLVFHFVVKHAGMSGVDWLAYAC
jgi:uncharacterized membrane protein SpoIIM required for sporulation